MSTSDQDRQPMPRDSDGWPDEIAEDGPGSLLDRPRSQIRRRGHRVRECDEEEDEDEYMGEGLP